MNTSRVLLDNKFVDDDIVNYINNSLKVIDINDEDEINNLYDFIININPELKFDIFISFIKSSLQESILQKTFPEKDSIKINFTKNNLQKEDFTKNNLQNTIIEKDIIPNKNSIVNKYSLIEVKNTTHKPIIKFENEKKIRYLDNRIVSTKGEKYINI